MHHITYHGITYHGEGGRSTKQWSLGEQFPVGWSWRIINIPTALHVTSSVDKATVSVCSSKQFAALCLLLSKLRTSDQTVWTVHDVITISASKVTVTSINQSKQICIAPCVASESEAHGTTINRMPLLLLSLLLSWTFVTFTVAAKSTYHFVTYSAKYVIFIFTDLLNLDKTHKIKITNLKHKKTC